MKRIISSFLLCLLSFCMILSAGQQSGFAGIPGTGALYSSESAYQSGGTEPAGSQNTASGHTGPAELSLPAPARYPAVAVPEKQETGQTEENIQSEGSYSFRRPFSGTFEEDAETLSFSVLGALLFALLLLAARSLFCPHLLVQARILSFIHSQDGLK